ncbi:LysR family transcriptional regulator ArgP [Pseudoruegeria sp. HB172150]|uniref:LysR family transcriptional regulator ArgP n=1 Tax=Pseudoruegeria sp. HB172150 TaxID=2721164 RepID=UPI00155459DF|nr:LysR family transcriptional regulator ArgP [Pseudoruegeria sp. HB172150]
MSQLDYAALGALAAVLRTGSFERAAAQLHVTPSAVSQRIRALEERMGAVLVLRGAPCRPTETGARLQRHAEAVGLMERALTEDLATLAPAPLKIAVNADSLATWFPTALAGAEGFLYDLVIDDQDHSHDWLKRGEVAAAVTGTPGPLQGCDSHPLGSLRYIATCSPGFHAKHFAKGVTADTLAAAPVMAFDPKDRLQHGWAARAAGREVPLTPHQLPSTHAFLDLACAGLAWGMNPEPLAAPHIAAGRLVPVLPDMPHDTPLYWQVSRHVAQALKPLTTSVLRAARQSLVPPN